MSPMDEFGEWAMEKAHLDDEIIRSKRETDRLRSLVLAILSKYERYKITGDYLPLVKFLENIDVSDVMNRRLPPIG